MPGPKISPPQGLEEQRITAIRFLGEQVGAPEKQLTSKLFECFRSHPDVRAAYLARVAYPDRPEVGVALCLGMESSIVNDAINEAIAHEAWRVFASMFSKNEHIDIIFVSQSQEAELAKVCRAFFSRD